MPDQEKTAEDPRYLEARRRVRFLKRFYEHAGLYSLVCFAVLIIDYFTGPEVWFFWVMLGWGVALMAHGYIAYGEWRLFGPAWEARKTDELLDRNAESSRQASS